MKKSKKLTQFITNCFIAGLLTTALAAVICIAVASIWFVGCVILDLPAHAIYAGIAVLSLLAGALLTAGE